MLITLRRFFRELGHPAEKCARLGHVPRVTERKGYVHPKNHRTAVVDGVTQKAKDCSRCFAMLSDWETTSRTEFQSASFHPDAWKTLRETGFTTGFSS